MYIFTWKKCFWLFKLTTLIFSTNFFTHTYILNTLSKVYFFYTYIKYFNIENGTAVGNNLKANEN